MTKRVFILMMIAASCTLTMFGCATVSTIEHMNGRSSLVYSGTKLNFEALAGKTGLPHKYNAKPPQYPILDIPGSFVLDTLLIPYTLGQNMENWLHTKGI